MKRILTRILIAVGVAGPFVAHVAAQDHRMITNIPFTFNVNETTMPAGRYQLIQSDVSGSGFLYCETLLVEQSSCCWEIARRQAGQTQHHVRLPCQQVRIGQDCAACQFD